MKEMSNALRRVSAFINENRLKYLSAVFFILALNLLQLAIPRITGTVVDLIAEGRADSGRLLLFPSLIMLAALFIYGLSYFSRLQIIGLSNLYDYNVRNSMFKHLENLCMSFFNRKSTGDIMALSINDLTVIRIALGRGIMITLNTLFLLVSGIIIMAQTMDLRLTLITFSPFPLLILIMNRFGKTINRRFKRVQESFAELTKKAQENISGIRVIKAFTQEEAQIKDFGSANSKNFDINMRMIKVWGLFVPFITLVASFSYFLLMYFGGPLVVRGSISIGDFIAFSSYIGILIHPIAFIGMIINQIQQARASADRIEDLLDEKPQVYDSIRAKAWKGPDRFRGEIEFKGVDFSYVKGGEKVLRDISFHIEPGSTVAFLGKIGSGKTTIAELILRFYNPEKRGCILIDGYDILDIPLHILRRNMAYVPQDNMLFSTSIRNNISFIPSGVSESGVESAAKASCIYDSIMEFTNGFDTILGERGVNLSGGQKQRISIARAIAADPAILILDDCLSAVDTATEKKILAGLEEAAYGRTCIMIAHRISTIKNADRIFVLERGAIVESGSHEKLMSYDGYYRNMYEMQLLEESLEDRGDE